MDRDPPPHEKFLNKKKDIKKIPTKCTENCAIKLYEHPLGKLQQLIRVYLGYLNPYVSISLFNPPLVQKSICRAKKKSIISKKYFD